MCGQHRVHQGCRPQELDRQREQEGVPNDDLRQRLDIRASHDCLSLGLYKLSV